MTDVPALDGPSQPPASGGPARQLVVLLHGYGADGNDLIALAPMLAEGLPGAAFIAPHAPEPCDAMPFGRQWFSFTQFDPDLWRRDPANLDRAMEAMGPGAATAAASLDAFLDAQMTAHGLGPDRVALIGFSQGTMVALHAALRRPAPLAAVIGFSGALPAPSALPAEITARPPVTLIHGEADPVVPVPALAHAAAGLKAAGVAVESHSRPGLEHGIDQDGLAICAGALAAAWPDAASGA